MRILAMFADHRDVRGLKLNNIIHSVKSIRFLKFTVGGRSRRRTSKQIASPENGAVRMEQKTFFIIKFNSLM